MSTAATTTIILLLPPFLAAAGAAFASDMCEALGAGSRTRQGSKGGTWGQTGERPVNTGVSECGGRGGAGQPARSDGGPAGRLRVVQIEGLVAGRPAAPAGLLAVS